LEHIIINIKYSNKTTEVITLLKDNISRNYNTRKKSYRIKVTIIIIKTIKITIIVLTVVIIAIARLVVKKEHQKCTKNQNTFCKCWLGGSGSFL
jgi:hypothetical protein